MTQLHVNKVRSLQSLAVANEPITIGRSSGNQVVLPSKRVSREHCVIEVIGDGAMRVRDLGSRHGTTVNGKTVSECKLSPGDVIGVGAFEIVVDDPMAPSSSGLDLAITDVTRSSPSTSAATIALEKEKSDLERRVAELTVKLEGAEARSETLASKLQATRERHEEAIAELTGAREAAESEAESQRTRRESREAELAQARDEHERRHAEAEAARSELLEKLGEMTTELDAARALAEKADRQLQSQTHALEDALARAAGLETRVAEAETAQREATEESRTAERAMARIREAIRELHAASERVTLGHENLAALEGLWLEADERLQESEQVGDLNLAESLQRDAISNHLEEAHAECESTVAELQEVALRLCRLITSEEGESRLAAATRKTGRRGPSMFRRSSRA